MTHWQQQLGDANLSRLPLEILLTGIRSITGLGTFDYCRRSLVSRFRAVYRPN